MNTDDEVIGKGSEMPVYLFPGMTPDERIFHRLIPRLPNATVVPFLPPESGESLSSYAKRIALKIPTRDCVIGGVSFGGLVALEVSRVIRPKACVLISSIRTPDQLPPVLRIWRLLAGPGISRVLQGIGAICKAWPRRLRSVSTARASKLAGREGEWHRWATSAVLRWKPDPEPMETKVVQIHGSADSTFPIRYTSAGVVIAGGGHLLPCTHSEAVANAIRKEVCTGSA